MSMEKCFENIKKKNGRYCGEAYCSAIQEEINQYCEHNGLEPNAPVPQKNAEGKCWCCCFVSNAVESSSGEYRPSEEIRGGDLLRTTGRGRERWEQRRVTEVGELAGRDAGRCYGMSFTMASGAQRRLVVIADSLFLLPSGKLKPVQDLRAGDQIADADGTAACINDVAVGRSGCTFSVFALGAFGRARSDASGRDDPLAGHLFNCFGLVTADLAVQTAFYAGDVDDLVDRTETAAMLQAVRDAEHADASARLITRPARWARGFATEARPVADN